jgi:hypothetical protein
MFKKIIGYIYFFSENKKSIEDNFDFKNNDDLLCRFVLDGLGIKLGESIALSNDIIIVKSKKKFLGIPLKHIQEKDNNLIVRGLVDKDKAIEIGEKWRKTSLNEMGNSKNEEK